MSRRYSAECKELIVFGRMASDALTGLAQAAEHPLAHSSMRFVQKMGKGDPIPKNPLDP